MDSKLSKKNISVAILIEDISEVQKISNIFKRIGVIPYFFNSLKDFWSQTYNERPKLIIADVMLLNEGDLFFKDHSFLKGSNPSELIFFYDKKSEPLLRSTYDMSSIGILKKSDLYERPLKSLLDRLNRLDLYRSSALSKSDIKNKFEAKIENLVGELQEKKNEGSIYQLEKSLSKKLKREIRSWGFQSGLAKFFEDQPWVEKFCLFELSNGGHKMICSKFDERKAIELPSMWLTQVCNDGMDYSAIDMGGKLFNKEIFGQFISLKIHSSKEGPDFLLFLNLNDSDILYKTDWGHLEELISGYYRLDILAQKKYFDLSLESHLGSWEFLEKLDESFEKDCQDLDSRTDHGEIELYNISFERLFDSIAEHPEIKFLWTDFYHKFITKLTKNIPAGLKYSHMGPSQLGLILKKDQSIDQLKLIKAFTDTFSYWKFFDDSDLILAKDLRPYVRSIPVFSDAYLKFLKGEDLYAGVDRAKQVKIIPSKKKPEISIQF